MVWQKGQSGNPSGSTSELKRKTLIIKTAIACAFNKRRFARWAIKNEKDFYEIMVKTMPKELAIEDVTNYKEIMKEELKTRLEILEKLKNVSTKE